MDGFIYEMPGLSRYRFSGKLECKNVETGRIIGAIGRKGRGRYFPLYMNDGIKTSIQYKEVEAYINHLKSVEQFNPLVFHHFIYYRPVLKMYYGVSKSKQHATIKNN